MDGTYEGREEPLLYGKKTSQRWRGRLELLESTACCVCQRRPPITGRLFDGQWAAIFSGGQVLPEEYLSKLWVDHDHETRIVRGMLCSDCNAAIFPLEFGHVMDTVREKYLAEGNRLRRAKEHLRHQVLKTADRGLRLVAV